MTVTGSCHLLEGGGARLLVDCGAFQGSRALFALNRDPLGFDAAAVEALLLEPPAVQALLREAVGDLARQLGGDGEVRDVGGGDEPLVLVARTGADGPRARRDVADRLAAIASARLEGADGWPDGALAAVQAVDDEHAGALAAVLVERAG
jgi:hypothetical protein